MPVADIGRTAPWTRKTPAVGAVIALAVAVVVGIGILRPFVQRWNAREAKLAEAQTKLADLTGVVANRVLADSVGNQREALLAQFPQRVLRAKSRALAASALQSLMIELAESSNVTVNRLDVAALETSGDLPFELSANGDILGLTDLLQRIRTARYIVSVREMTVQNTSALRGAPDVLQVTLSLDAPVIVQ